MPSISLSRLAVLRLIAVAGWITKSSCFSTSTTLPNQRALHSFFASFQRQSHLSSKLSASTETSSSEIDNQKGMKEAFDSLDTLSPDDVAPYWKNKPNTPLKHCRTDDTQALYYGKSSDDEVTHYLEMQQELEGDESSTTESEETADEEGEDILDDWFDKNGNVDGLTPDDVDAQYPWESINPILRLRGPVATGYGRGGKKLGVPTANLPSSLFQSALENVDAGVYFGWAVVEGTDSRVKNAAIKAVVNVGYSPTFEGKENKEKIVEAHLITKASPMTKYEGNTNTFSHEEDNNIITPEEIEINQDFYGETMRLQLIGFLRPEQKFDSFPDLIAQIHRDIGHAAAALDSFPYVFSKEDEFISNCKDGVWIGSGGGDDNASWEYEAW